MKIKYTSETNGLTKSYYVYYVYCLYFLSKYIMRSGQWVTILYYRTSGNPSFQSTAMITFAFVAENLLVEKKKKHNSNFKILFSRRPEIKTQKPCVFEISELYADGKTLAIDRQTDLIYLSV